MLNTGVVGHFVCLVLAYMQCIHVYWAGVMSDTQFSGIWGPSKGGTVSLLFSFYMQDIFESLIPQVQRDVYANDTYSSDQSPNVLCQNIQQSLHQLET